VSDPEWDQDLERGEQQFPPLRIGVDALR